MLLKDKVCLITGSSRGIGAETAKMMAKEKAKVIINYYKNKKEAEEVVKEIEEINGEVIAVQADVRDIYAVKKMVKIAIKKFKKIDVLVNNAWVGFEGGEIDKLPWKVYEHQIEGILKGAYNCINTIVPYMREQKQGSIINIGTTSLYEGVEDKYHTPYISAKGALLSLTHGLANDLGKDGIRVNMVSPSVCWKDRKNPQPNDFAVSHRQRIPLLNRNVETKDVAKVIIFYASHLSEFVTGTHLPVCGGLVMCVG